MESRRLSGGSNDPDFSHTGLGSNGTSAVNHSVKGQSSDDTQSLSSVDGRVNTSNSSVRLIPCISGGGGGSEGGGSPPGAATAKSKHESLKVQKKHYRHEKKRAAEELLSTLKDPAVIIIADWLKVRGSLKSWTKLWCVLKPGLLVLYKSPKAKSSHWVGTVLLNTCEVLERPSKKDGFCFKVFHPLDKSIWATKGPEGETIGALVQPLPYSHLIFRAPSESVGKCWMDAMELGLRCANLLLRTMVRTDTKASGGGAGGGALVNGGGGVSVYSTLANRQSLNESDCEWHFHNFGLDEDSRTDREDGDKTETDTEEEREEEREIKRDTQQQQQPVIQTPYVENTVEELGQEGETSQTMQCDEDDKSLIWSLVKQVRPGMDLSKVTLPTFILEPRSLLDKLSDYYYHADLLSTAAQEEDAYTRMKMIVRWYISGFYKKPKGLKKPYNPILGEVFRCCWVHPNSNSKTFYISEQISHHPPVSAFYVTNRREGFSVSGTILARSKFYGNSLSALLDGSARVSLLHRGEEYIATLPYAHCKGILIGTLTMEMGGPVTIVCEKTGYWAELEFKLKPFLGSGSASNRLVGKIKLGEETLATLDGHWDKEIIIKDKRSGETQSFWNPGPEVRAQRLKRFTVPLDAQAEYESERLWQHTSEAILRGDCGGATHEKLLVEDRQRMEVLERKAKLTVWTPRLFTQNIITGDWVYKYSDLRPWDSQNDVVQYEKDFKIVTHTLHVTPILLTTSITNIDNLVTLDTGGGEGGGRGRGGRGRKLTSIKRRRYKNSRPAAHISSSNDEDEAVNHDDNESEVTTRLDDETLEAESIYKAIEPLVRSQKEYSDRLTAVQSKLDTIHTLLQTNQKSRDNLRAEFSVRDLALLVGVMLTVQLLVVWWFK